MKYVETACYALAVVGIILTWLGRRLLIIEAASVSSGWLWAIRLLPLADVMFLARFWETAKGGAFTSLAGLLLLLPLGAKTLWDHTHPAPVDFAERGRALSGDEKIELFTAMRAEHEERIAAKRRKLQRLNEHMGAWHASMSQRRAALTAATPEQLARFNEEAAAYKALHDVTKNEAAELQAMLNQHYDGWSTIPNEEYGRYLAEGEQRRARNPRNASRGIPAPPVANDQ